ncbi:single-stranded DNA-binding protein [Nocardia cyriacigeorgica]|uniref:single-stranded DNA-binding protein n=1 Tax=Nocardia cyriacigeorgica TaxID=135487 RepID=UPI0018933170|nr:single-stranded DNA-binding protein [Nocardia cyriacigeorgica]MBF6102255.1 single-stranded DNA-binding protein [Nocardia cyriacigeorgica]
MAGDTVVTVTGNVTDSPELRFTPAGVAVANFTVASTPRFFDRQSNEWKDADALFLRCTLWREPAEHAAESLTRGARVIVTGRLKQRTYETREGQTRTVVELDVDELGASLRYATATISRVNRASVTSSGSNTNTGGQTAWDAQQSGEPAFAGSGFGNAGQPPF